MSYIYVLQLANDYYYVGKSANVSERYKRHVEGTGSEWTKIHKVDRLIEISEERTPFDEDNKVKEMMLKHGIDRVRGGSYSQINLSASDLTTLNKEFSSVQNTCFKCKKPGHYARDCPDSSRSTDSGAETRAPILCTRCGRNSHTVDKCFAKTRLDGTSIDTSTRYAPSTSSDAREQLLKPIVNLARAVSSFSCSIQ